MKMSVADLELRLMPFLNRIVQTMPTGLHKWLGGAMAVASAPKIESLLANQADADGLVDTEALKRVVDAGFQASGGEVTIPFGNEGLAAFGVKPVNVKISQADANQFFASL